MVQVSAAILIHRKVARDHFLMRLKVPAIAQGALPGQFVHVRCREDTFPLLRRPFSLFDSDPEAGTVEFIYKVVGLGTSALSEIPVGSRVDILGPLGTSFVTPEEPVAAYLVGGGVGIPPLYFLAKNLKKRHSACGIHVSAFLGARTRDWVICLEPFRKLGVQTHVATDDGTLGYRGSVVDLMKKFLRNAAGEIRSADRGIRDTLLYVCGPTAMMAAAARLARQKRLPAQVSLEERMGCAMGCCMGCVVEVATEPVTSHKRFQRVCTEGPVFPAEAILWK